MPAVAEVISNPVRCRSVTYAAVARVWAADIRACAAGLLRFATPGELDALLGDPLTSEAYTSFGTLTTRAHTSYGMLNQAVVEASLRRAGRPPADLLTDPALYDPKSCLLGRVLDLDDPEVNGALFLSPATPRNVLRQLAGQTSRRDGVTPVPLPEHVLREAGSVRLLNALLHSPDPDIAAHALRALGPGAEHHGAVRACRLLLDTHRSPELRQLEDRLPGVRWGPEESEPSVGAYVRAALRSQDGAERLRELSERVRRPEWLTSVAELGDAAGRDPLGSAALVRSVVHRRHPCAPRIDWTALLAAEPERRRREGPFPYPVARLLALRHDTPYELLRQAVSDHPEVAPLVTAPTPELLADVCERLALLGAPAAVKVAGNGFVAGTLTAEQIASVLPAEALELYAESLWIPGLRGTAALRTLTGRAGDVVLRPFFCDETGHGPRHRLRSPSRWADWDAAAVYGPRVADALRHRELSADDVLSMVSPDAVLAPGPAAPPDPRVLRRLAELVHQNLGGRPKAWTVALLLLARGFVGTLPELLVAAGAAAA
ncbi:hypothetical protein SAMN05421874_10670 [Nonomuraea maritima]|uniref:Uncharacterized protein n=1 Tax=Nonomuraea maritima TaxID=683260 RepID=A0A1G9A790_9ACTN|nr:hypothetical protein SAMN05421874_10670 [Nonomuraea maritima]